MKPIVCDTSPLNYLMQIGRINLLPELYSSARIPTEVFDELKHPGAPEIVRRWAMQPPTWAVHWRVVRRLALPADEGEVAALALAVESKCENVLMDDARGRALALQLNLNPIGTLRFLELAWEERLTNLEEDLLRLESLNFRAHPRLFTALRSKIAQRK
jgi:predicted nucleic acid-binding protein